MKKYSSLFILVAFLVIFSGCSKQAKTETSLEQTESIDGMTVTLHKVAFESNGVLLDYTIRQEGKELEQPLVQVSIPQQELCTDAAYELVSETNQKESEKHAVALCIGQKEAFLTAEDKGKTAVIEFLKLPETDTYTGNTADLEGIRIEMEIPQLLETEIIPLEKKLSYEEGQITVAQMEYHAGYDLLRIQDGAEAFMTGFYTVERTNAAGEKSEILTMYNQGEDYFIVYEPMGTEAKNMSLKVVQAKKDGTWREAGKAVELKWE